jgi:hypothetical protein
MTEDKAWTSIVIATGETTHHGRDPQNLDWTLCGTVSVAGDTLYRGVFYGTNEDDCQTCSELLPNSHY